MDVDKLAGAERVKLKGKIITCCCEQHINSFTSQDMV